MKYSVWPAIACVVLALSAGAQQDDRVPQLYPGTNVSLETLDLFGVFYHRQASFPEVRQFSDVAIVKLVRTLEKPEQTPADFNTFILDATQGVVLFSIGLKGMNAASIPRFRGASRMTVLPNGRLAVVLADSTVDLCASFGGESIQSSSACKPLPMQAASLAASGSDDVVVLTKNGALGVIDSTTGEQETLDVPLAKINEVHADGETLALIHSNGRSVATFRNVGGNCVTEWEAWRSCQRSSANAGKACNDTKRAFQDCKKKNPGNHTVRFKFVPEASIDSVSIPFADGTSSSPLDLSSLTRNRDGRYYVLSPSNDLIVLLGRKLELTAAIMSFPPRPRPLRRVSGARGIRMVPSSVLLHVFSTNAIETLAEEEQPPEELARRTPAELLPIYGAIDAIPFASFLADPAQDITARPEIRDKILQAIANLKRK